MRLIVIDASKGTDEVVAQMRKHRKMLDVYENTPQAKSARRIVDDIRRRGDDALFHYVLKYDHVEMDASSVRVPVRDVSTAFRRLPQKTLKALRTSIENVREFQERLMPREIPLREAAKKGVKTALKLVPVQRAGIYVPGGSTGYPSTLVMTAVPAQVAGVESIVLCSPPRKRGRIDSTVLACAKELGIQEIYRLGGVQAIAAMAFGTESIPAVDMVVGPGNRYVTLAKQAVFGAVGIDMLAGPSEVLVIADEKADPSLIAAELLAQAEHDAVAPSILVTTSRKLIDQVENELDTQMAGLPRSSIAYKSLQQYGLAVLVRTLDAACDVANAIAPEHLALYVSKPRDLLPKVKNAGTVFLGEHTPVVVGDYVAGPSHVLPTGGTARFSSGLSALTFLRTMAVVECGKKASKALEAAATLAEAESLEAHRRAATMRRSGRLKG